MINFPTSDRTDTFVPDPRQRDTHQSSTAPASNPASPR